MKKKVIIAICMILAALLVIFSINYFNNKRIEKEIKESITKIDDNYNSFKQEKDRAKKLKILKSLEKESATYSKNSKKYAEVTSKYSDVIKDAKNYFIKEYDQSIQENTIEKLEECKDKELINTNKTQLQSISEKINNEKETVCDEKEVKNYKDKIDELIQSYNEKVKQIEKEEADTKAKAEEEAKAKAEAEDQAQKEAEETAQSQQSNNYNSDNSGSSSNNYNSSNNNTGYTTNYYVNGEYCGHTDENGNMYDSNGNLYGNKSDPVWN